MKQSLLFAALALGLSTAQAAPEVLPTGYVFDRNTDCGAYCYHDSTGRELIDGRYGRVGWRVDLGNGPAAEWVGWGDDPVVNIDFTFDGPVTVDRVDVGSTQNRLDDVVLPTVSVFAWVDGDWTLMQTLITQEQLANNADEFSTEPHEFRLLTTVGIVGTERIRVQLRYAEDGPWTFVDEVDFYAPVPEPSVAWLAGAALPVLLAARRRRTRGG